MPRTARSGRPRLAERQADIRIGRCIRERREIMGISRERLAGALGISAEQLRRCEAGTATVAASRLYLLSVILAVPASSFFGHSVTGHGPAPDALGRLDGQGAPSDNELMRVVEIVRRIPDSATRAEVIALVAAVAEMSRTDWGTAH